MHIIRDDKNYILFDNYNCDIYSLTKEQGEKLYGMGDDNLNELYHSMSQNISLKREEPIVDKRVGKIALVISQTCNMKCKYCYAQQGTYGNDKEKRMSLETLQKAILFLLQMFPEGFHKLQFFGGEPLMNFELLKQALPWMEDVFANRHIVKPLYSIVTNGTLITPEVHNFFEKYQFSVTISIDGNKEVNDVNRVFQNSNRGTFDTIKKNVEMINKNRKYPVMFEVTVDKANVLQYKENKNVLLDLEELMKLKTDQFHVAPAIWPKECSDCTLNNKKYLGMLKEYFSDVAKKSFETSEGAGQFHLIATESMVSNIINKKRKSHICGAALTELSIAVNGDIYPCFTFIGNEEYCMGNVHKELNDKYQKIKDLCYENCLDHIESCRDCWANGYCANCIGNAYLVNGSIDKPVKEFCVTQKELLEQVIKKCYHMVNEKKEAEQCSIN